MNPVTPIRPGQPEQRTEILAELRMTLDALGETCLQHAGMKANIDKLLAMLAPGAATDALRAELDADLAKFAALAAFNAYTLERVRSGAFRRLAGMFR
jgi:hypothetical protein